MITTQTIKLKKPNAKLDNLWIENQLSKLGFEVIRWAIIEISETEITLTVSHKSH